MKTLEDNSIKPKKKLFLKMELDTTPKSRRKEHLETITVHLLWFQEDHLPLAHPLDAFFSYFLPLDWPAFSR